MKNKTKLRLIKGMLLVLLLIAYITLEAFYFGPRRLQVTYQTLQSNKIPQEFNDFSIAFFSDTHYLVHGNNQKLVDVVDTLLELQPDMVLFGGDLIDHPSRNLINQEEKEALIASLKSIEAPYGKYAVYGNHDLEGLATREQTKEILQAAGFRILNNESIKIHKQGDRYIQLIGLDSLLLGSPDLTKAFQGIRVDDYSLLLCHTPDILNDINTILTDTLFSGHSHGHQVYLPFISNYFLPSYATKYNRGRYQRKETTLFVTNGIGTTVTSARLFASPEIMFFRLKHIEANTPVSTTTKLTGTTTIP